MTEGRAPYPVRVDAAEEPAASRGLWLVKWLLLIPHYVVLAFLWIAFVLFSIVAFFAILFTGRYPRALFEFNVGVLRWSWRVEYYGYAALGTDRYPPFTLAERPDYPARLDVPYPRRLSRGLVLVKWWLLALPHYVVLGVFIGGGLWLGTSRGDQPGWDTGWGAGGLVGLLVLIAAIVLLFSGRYPRALYDFILGMNRWALRVAAYAGLMTDAYPPFRLDMGGTDPGTTPAAPSPPAPAPEPLAATPAAAAGPAAPAAAGPATRGGAAGWTAGRIVAVVAGAVFVFAGAGLLTAGGGLLWADSTQRVNGYLSSQETTVTSARHAVVADSFRLEGSGVDWVVDQVTGTAQFRVRPDDTATSLFLGIGPTASVQNYLRGVGQTQLTDFGAGWWDSGLTWKAVDHLGGAPAVPPTRAAVWTASVSGPGVQTLTWRPSAGDWTVVVMHPNGAPGVAAHVQVGLTLPGLTWIAASVVALGAVLLALGGLLIGLAVRGAARALPAGAVPGGGIPSQVPGPTPVPGPRAAPEPSGPGTGVEPPATPRATPRS